MQKKMGEQKKKGFANRIGNILGGHAHRNEGVSAMDAFMKTKYGDIKTPEQYVEVARRHIRRMITTRMNPERYTPDEPRFRSYCAVIDFDREMAEHVKDIFAPFLESGFEVVKLSGTVPSVKSEHLYLISWDKRQ